ncbi:related to AGA1 A-agglutinin anchor subunit [Phialocephala subalpina]|uniref:Related to AGA1 A-agglutinin anchor subunit n=1 Tax=Phialocephala subalpina TaxID=576137 RepID=A0A1L7WYH6_9HELO|nr:related to AGA1 A-agglutinin anchor subunit [Phialocephala subalpina]
MRFTPFACAAALTAVASAVSDTPARAAAAQGATGTTLLANAIQSGSFVDGSQEIGANEAQQAKSLTSTNNFINNCAGKTLTNGLQITTGSCNGIPMGDLPAKTAMVSSVITYPTTGGKDVVSDTTFNISVQMSNLVAGSFTNADATYFGAPQFLQGGQVVGHTHVTVQDMGNSLNPTTALDATQFAFFKGINDAGNGKGLLQAVVTGGLPAGNYRVCTMASASNHQPVIMPVAQRGTADDCTKFVVSGSGTTANAASNDGSGGVAAAAAAASAVAAGPGAVDPAIADAASSTAVASKASATAAAKGNGGNANAAASAGKAAATTAANANAGKGGNANGAKGGRAGGRKQKARREFIA